MPRKQKRTIRHLALRKIKKVGKIPVRLPSHQSTRFLDNGKGLQSHTRPRKGKLVEIGQAAQKQLAPLRREETELSTLSLRNRTKWWAKKWLTARASGKEKEAETAQQPPAS